MRIIEIDGSDWQSVKDFLTTLRAAIGAPDWHGWSVNAFIDSMIWGGINQIEPPYEIRISGRELCSQRSNGPYRSFGFSACGRT